MKLKILLPIALVLAAVAAPRGEIIEQILVKVNGDIFTKSDLEQRQITALRQKGQAIDLKSDPNNVELRKALAAYTETNPPAGDGWHRNVMGLLAWGIAERVDDYCATAFVYCRQAQAVPPVDAAAAVADIATLDYETPLRFTLG